jgi:hypothetical protein
MLQSSISVSMNRPLLNLFSDLSSVNNVDVTIFLVSLKAGGVALNLTEASRVYLMDSWWNPAVCLFSFSFSALANGTRCRSNSVRLRVVGVSQRY